MRHPPHSVLLVGDGPVALVPSAVLPVFSARGATAEYTVGHTVINQRPSGSQVFEPIDDRDAEEQSRTDDVQARRDDGHRGCEPRGSAHRHRRGLGGPHRGARQEVPARTVWAPWSVHGQSGRLLGRAGRLPEADAGLGPRSVQLGVDGRCLRTPPGVRVHLLEEHHPDRATSSTTAALKRRPDGGTFHRTSYGGAGRRDCGDAVRGAATTKGSPPFDGGVTWFDDHEPSCPGRTLNARDCSRGPSPKSACDGTATA